MSSSRGKLILRGAGDWDPSWVTLTEAHLKRKGCSGLPPSRPVTLRP